MSRWFNSPLVYADPAGDIAPLLFIAAAAIGAGSNMYNNWGSIVKNPWSAIGYGLSGEAGGAVSVVNPVLGGTITAGGNLVTDVASGNIPNFNSFTDVAGYAGGLALDGLSAAGAGKLAKLGQEGLRRIAKDVAQDMAFSTGLIATEVASEVAFEYAGTKVGETALTMTYGSISVAAKAPSHLIGASLGVGASAFAGGGNGKKGLTEPKLPPKTLAEGNGVTIEHYYRSNDHPTAHAHVKGGGPDTGIGPNGKPFGTDSPMTPKQQRVYDANKSSIRRNMNKIGRWLKCTIGSR